MSRSYDLVVVGAGPAGAAAATEAADAGLTVLVVDEQRAPGGQIFRRTPPEFGASSHLPKGYPWAERLLERVERHPGVELRSGTTVFGVLRDGPGSLFEVCLSGGSGPDSVLARRILIATGAYDMPVAIPGWTLPGVMMAGAVQGFLKSQRMRVADRVVLAGSHPLLLIVAAQLLAAGAEIEEVAFARGLPSLRELIAALPAVPGHVRLLAELAGCVLRLLRAGVRISLGVAPVGVDGDTRVRSVRLAPVDRSWRVRGAERTVEADTVVLGYGFLPSTELARQLGCELVWDSALGGWVVSVDDRFESSVPGIFVAGEPIGIAGAEQSRGEGELAGREIARDAGRAVDARRIAASRRRIARSRRFARVVQWMFAPRREGLLSLATPETEVCRCETVTRAEVDGFLDENPFATTGDAVKLACRTGMGPCQGRYCEVTVAGVVAHARGTSIEESGRFAVHIPIKPVSLETYAALADRDEPQQSELRT